MPLPVDPHIAFEWLTTEKAAGLVAIIAAIAAYTIGGRKRDKSEAAASAGGSMTRTNELLEETLGVLRGIGRQQHDRADVDHAVHVQIRDEIRLLRGDDGWQGDPVRTSPRPRRRRKPAV